MVIFSFKVLRPYLPRGGSRPGPKHVTVFPFYSKLLLQTGRICIATNQMHSNALVAFGMKWCYIWFHSEVKFLTRFRSLYEAKEKYRGMLEIQKSGDKTSSVEICLDIRTHASPKVGHHQVSGEVSVLCWNAAPVAYDLWKPCTIR